MWLQLEKGKKVQPGRLSPARRNARGEPGTVRFTGPGGKPALTQDLYGVVSTAPSKLSHGALPALIRADVRKIGLNRELA